MPEQMPVGANVDDFVEPVVEPIEPVVEPAAEPAPKLYAGKYKTPEEMEAAYTGLESKMGEQGNELGTLRKDKDFLMSQIEQAKSETATVPDQAVNLEQQLTDIQTQVEEGDLSIGEGLVKTAKISSQMASETAVRSVQDRQTQDLVDNSRKAFADSHPDFFEMQQSGALEEVKATAPGLHDDYSAYWELKATLAAGNLETVRLEGVEAGKAEMKKVAAGDERTGKVLQGSGEQAKNIGKSKTPLSGRQLQESGLAALKKSRGE